MRTCKTYACRPLWRYGTLILMIFIVDQYAKKLSIKLLTGYSYNFGPFIFTLVRNSGAAFGILHHSRTTLLCIVPALCLCIIALMHLSHTRISSSERIGYNCILAGACTNYYDRIVHGYVVDFLAIRIGSFTWPAFNLADIAICTGVIFILYGTYTHKSHQKA